MSYASYYPPSLYRHDFSPEPLDWSSHLSTRDVEALPKHGQLVHGNLKPDLENETRTPEGTDQSSLPPVDSIPKPKGTVGKPHNGGYTLAKELGWSFAEYNAVQAYFREVAKTQLDSLKTFGSQDKGLMTTIYETADERFPRLRCYINRWASRDRDLNGY